MNLCADKNFILIGFIPWMFLFSVVMCEINFNLKIEEKNINKLKSISALIGISIHSIIIINKRPFSSEDYNWCSKEFRLNIIPVSIILT